jgi:HEAT repeat protein
MTMASRQEIEALLTRRVISDDELRELGQSAVPVLIDIFLHDTSEWNDGKRRMALHVLGLLGNERAVEFLIATAENIDEEDWLRTAAVRSLGYASHDKALAYLESTLNHEDYDFKKSAVMALSHSTGPEARELLEKAHADDDERIRGHADKLLDDGSERVE